MTDSTTGRARPLVAVGYGPRCVPVMQLAERPPASRPLWIIDTAVPGIGEVPVSSTGSAPLSTSRA